VEVSTTPGACTLIAPSSRRLRFRAPPTLPFEPGSQYILEDNPALPRVRLELLDRDGQCGETVRVADYGNLVTSGGAGPYRGTFDARFGAETIHGTFVADRCVMSDAGACH